MNKHTPGPWIAVGGYVENPDDSKADICSCEPADFGQRGLHRTVEEICANARLIAAAPELLEALKLAYLYINGGPGYTTENFTAAHSAARAAIAKATGEQA